MIGLTSLLYIKEKTMWDRTPKLLKRQRNVVFSLFFAIFAHRIMKKRKKPKTSNSDETIG